MKSVLTPLVLFLVRCLARSWRYRLEGTAPAEASFVLFWHGQMLPVWYWFARSRSRKLGLYAVVSQSKDGQILSDLLAGWGYLLVRGSSSKGGSEALSGMVEAAADSIVLVTPDGPRGPRCQAKVGAFVASQRSCRPYQFVQLECTRVWIFRRSWDQFIVPKPFSEITLRFSDRSVVELDASRAEIEALAYHTSSLFGY